jgi:hypothetical protein
LALESFRGDFTHQEWNEQFWKLKESICGVKAPVERTRADLDPPTIFHVCQDFDMIRYFVRTILQFQFAERLCQVSGHTGPLHRFVSLKNHSFWFLLTHVQRRP